MNELDLHFIAVTIGYSTRCTGWVPSMFLFRTHPITCGLPQLWTFSLIKYAAGALRGKNLAALDCRCSGAAPYLEEAMTKFSNAQPEMGARKRLLLDLMP